jgi:hypothetical protein
MPSTLGITSSAYLPDINVMDYSPQLWLDGSDASTFTYASPGGAYFSEDGLYIPNNINGNGLYSSNATGTNMPGDFTIIVHVKPFDLTPNQTLVFNGNARTNYYQNYVFRINNGRLTLYRPSGSTDRDYTSTATLGVTNDTPIWVKVDWRENNGSNLSEARFFKSSDGESWTEVGSPVTSGAGLGNVNLPYLHLASFNLDGTFTASNIFSTNFRGTFYRVIIKDGVDGQTVFDADLSNAVTYGSGTFTESSLNRTNMTLVSTSGFGRAISQWRDKSGNNNHANQSTASRQPSIRMSNNGTIAPFFTASSVTHLNINNQTFSTPCSFYYCLSLGPVPGSSYIMDGNAARWYFYNTGGAGSPWDTSFGFGAPSFPYTDNFTLSWTFTQFGSLYRNGRFVTFSSANGGSSITDWRIGSRFSNSEALNGFINELIVIPNATYQPDIDAYLKNKWAIRGTT